MKWFRSRRHAGVWTIAAFVVGCILYAAWRYPHLEQVQEEIEVFVVFALAPAFVFFTCIFFRNLIIAPGELLKRDNVRTIVSEIVADLRKRWDDGGRIIEDIKLISDQKEAQYRFERWRKDTIDYISSNLPPSYIHIFNDVELGGLGAILDINEFDYKIYKDGAQKWKRELIDVISRRRHNLSNIIQSLAPMTVSGELWNVPR
jgi:hypothetical protein